MKAAFTICSANYLSQALSLEESIQRTNPELSFFIFLTDKKPVFTDNSNIVELTEIGFEKAHFNDLIESYNIIEFNTAVKAQCFSYLFSHKACEQVLYFDPDILVFSDLSLIWKHLTTNNAIVTPHLLDLVVKPELKHLTIGTINTGVFNLGFIGLTKNETTLKFVAWWNNHLRHLGHNNILNGEFYDQKVINLLPAVMDQVHISRNYGLNVAEWNLHERSLSKKDNSFFVNENTPLTFFHFSGVKISSAEANYTNNSLLNASKSETLTELLNSYIDLNVKHDFNRYKSIACFYQLRPNIHRASRWEIYRYKLKTWLKSK